LKFVPVTVKASGPLPGATVEAERLAVVGTGLFTLNDFATNGLPPGFCTVTSGVPAAAMALAGIDAVSIVGVWYAEETGFPAKVTVDKGPNPVPMIMSVNVGPPTFVLAGLNAPMVGCEFAGRTVSVIVDDVPPPAPARPPTGFVMKRLIAPGEAIAEAATVVVTCEELT